MGRRLAPQGEDPAQFATQPPLQCPHGQPETPDLVPQQSRTFGDVLSSPAQFHSHASRSGR
jgi:hypothetical protein